MLVVALTAIIGGCNFNKATPQTQKPIGYEVEDEQGKRITLPGKPQRIVSLTLGTDEMLLSLVAPNRLAALTYLADDPGISNVAESAKQVAGRVKANLESVISLKPDLVIVASWQPVELIKSIKEAGIPVYVYQTPTTVEEIKRVIRKLAALVGEEGKGTELIEKMDADLHLISEKIKNNPPDQKKVVIRYTLMGATYGKGSLFDEICKYANVENGVAKAEGSAFEYLPKEKIIAVNPDVFILPAWDFTGEKDAHDFKNEVQHDPAFQSVSAIQNHQLMIIPDKYVSSASQYMIKGIQEVVVAAYPESR